MYHSQLCGKFFENATISRRDPLDFFLWGFVKDVVHVPPMPITLNNLKD
jgi:hypothetical protein